METIGTKHGRVVATATYLNHSSADLMVPIEGKLTADNRFWPVAQVEVAPDLQAGWQPVTPVEVQGQNIVYTVRYNAPQNTLYFDLQPLLPFVQSMRFARLSLKSGETAILVLEDLVKRANPPSEDSDEKIAIYDGVHEPEVRPPFIFLRANSTAQKSIGVFGYGTLEGPAVELEGTKTDNDEFWINARCEVSNELDEGWQLIGKTSARGTPAKLVIAANDVNVNINADLDSFRPYIGQYRYGRITTAAGVSARFELFSLLPKSGLVINQ